MLSRTPWSTQGDSASMPSTRIAEKSGGCHSTGNACAVTSNQQHLRQRYAHCDCKVEITSHLTDLYVRMDGGRLLTCSKHRYGYEQHQFQKYSSFWTCMEVKLFTAVPNKPSS